MRSFIIINSGSIKFIAMFFGLLVLATCTKDVGKLQSSVKEHHYPEQIANIILNKCATSGCHNQISKDAAAGLNLETWNTLFEGSRGGAVVIPYRTDFSTLLFYTNSYSQFGNIQLLPKMPINQQQLSATELKLLFDWIQSGAPDANGNIKFGDNLNRKKFYVTNQGCDVVSVFDAQSMLAMRCVNVGETPAIEAPHMIKVSPDNQHWYVSFIGSGIFQKYKTIDNSLAGKVNLGVGSWNTFVFSSDSKTAYVIDWSSFGKIAVVDLNAMTVTTHFGFNYPHGSALNKTDNYLYVTSQNGNYIYKLDVNNFSSPKQITLDNSHIPLDIPSLNAHEIQFTPNGEKYFVTCQDSNQVRVMQTSNDSLLAIIPVGIFPQEMSISNTTPYLFVSCMNDKTSNPQQLGSIYIINYITHSVVKSLYAGYQPHGVVVDDINKRVYVGNRNVLSSGPTPHHQGVCAGRNGYITAINLNTLEMIKDYKAEVSIDPYGLGITH